MPIFVGPELHPQMSSSPATPAFEPSSVGGQRLVARDGERWLSLRDPSAIALLLFAVALQVVSWRMQYGYPIADAVEYMDRAYDWSHGRTLPAAAAVRSFAYSSLFLPLFTASQLLGVEDERALLWIARGLGCFSGLALVWVCAKLGDRIGGRSAGIASGVFAAANPFLLIYTVWPISGPMAALCVALGLERLIERSTFRRELMGGLMFGIGFLFAYQVFLMVATVAFAILVRDRWKHKSAIAGITLGFAIAVAVQVFWDRIVYWRWGVTVFGHFVDNFGSILVRWLAKLGLRDLASSIYRLQADIQGYNVEDPTGTKDPRALQPPDWYLDNLPEMIAIPALILIGVGVVWAVRKRRATALALLVLILANAWVLSAKGSKSFRLWIPLIPMIAPLVGFGFAAFWVYAGRGRSLARLAAVGLLAAVIPLGVRQIARESPRYHGVYWQAMDWINRELEEHPRKDSRPSRMGAGYNWAVFLRNSPAVRRIRFNTPLDMWRKLGPRGKEYIRGMLDDLDGVVVHLPILQSTPELFRYVNERYNVLAAFYDQRVHAGLGPVYVLGRRPPNDKGRHFFEFESTQDPDGYARSRGFDRPVRFVCKVEDREEELLFLGFGIEDMPGSDHQWITYHWYAATDITRDFRVIDRITGPDLSSSWHNNHFPAYKAIPTSQWKKGTLVRESHLLVASVDAFYTERPYWPLGGGFRRGDLMPARLWIAVLDGDEREGHAPALEVRELLTEATPRATLDADTLWNVDGWRFSPAGLVQVGSFLLPVHRWARVPDDGRPMPAGAR